MKKITIFLILISSIYGESLRSKFYYDSVLSCDEVREKIVFVKGEMVKIDKQMGQSFFISFNLPAIADDIKYSELEERLENLQSLEQEKCRGLK